MGAVEIQHFRTRARDFLKGMELLRDDLNEYRSSSALLGIHGAISYSDALRTGMGSRDVAADDHRKAAQELGQMLDSRRYGKPGGVDRLSRLLRMKSIVEYSADALTENKAKEIVDQAQRFAAWAEETGKTLKIEGW